MSSSKRRLLSQLSSSNTTSLLAILAGFPSRLWFSTSPTLRFGVGTILTLVSASVFIFKQALHISALEALYFVISTITTVGYGDITPLGRSEWVIGYGILLMLLGSATLATLYSVLTDYIVRTRLDQILGRRAHSEVDHVIFVGLGNVGYRIVQELGLRRVPVAVIEKSMDNDLRELLPKTVPFLVGDARDLSTLELAGLGSATALISATEDDATNLSVCLVAKAQRPELKVVARLFDDLFASKVEAHLPIDCGLSASRIAAPVFVGAALYDDSVHAYQTDSELVVISRSSSGEEFLVTSHVLV